MAVTLFIRFKAPGDDTPYGTVFNPETDRYLTAEERERLGSQWGSSPFGANDGYRTLFEGRVLATREYNGHDDSDFYALVWNGTGIERYEYATTRSWTYLNGARVDATPEVLAEVAEWVAVQRERAVKVQAFLEATQIVKGVQVEVVKGRKVPKGTVGEVFWRGEDQWKSSRWATFYRLGIRDEAGETHWTAEDNVVRVGAPTEEPDRPVQDWQMVGSYVKYLQKEAVAA